MTTPVQPHLVFTLSRPYCYTNKHYGCKSQLLSAHWPEVSGVLSGLRIVAVALREVVPVPGYVRKTQL